MTEISRVLQGVAWHKDCANTGYLRLEERHDACDPVTTLGDLAPFVFPIYGHGAHLAQGSNSRRFNDR